MNIILFFLLVKAFTVISGSDVQEYDYIEDIIDPDRNLSEVRYLLWTRSNPASEDYFSLEVEDLDSLNASPFDSSLRTYFYVHGFGGNGEEQWILDSKTRTLTLMDSNVISVDYRTLVSTENYEAGVKNMYQVANLTASYIDWLVGVTTLTTSQIHVVGHSLGGQLAGMIGKYTTAGILDRITPLDPAGPLFYDKPPNERVDKSDAAFVDVMHCNSGFILEGCVGLYAAVGHVDFYPNGGSHQFGCLPPGNTTIDNWIDLFTGCSHARAHDYWVESIYIGYENGTDLDFVSWPCQDWETFEYGNCPDCGQGCLNMGFNVDRSLEGTYFLKTRIRSPFAKGDIQ